MRLPVIVAIHRASLLARLLCRGDIVAVMLGTDGCLSIERRAGAREEVALDPSTTVFPALVVLRFRVGSRLESLALPQAATGAEAHRQLRVWLGWQAQTRKVSVSV